MLYNPSRTHHQRLPSPFKIITQPAASVGHPWVLCKSRPIQFQKMKGAQFTLTRSLFPMLCCVLCHAMSLFLIRLVPKASGDPAKTPKHCNPPTLKNFSHLPNIGDGVLARTWNRRIDVWVAPSVIGSGYSRRFASASNVCRCTFAEKESSSYHFRDIRSASAGPEVVQNRAILAVLHPPFVCASQWQPQ